MPEALARNPSATVFHYKGITSPPKDWNAWVVLVQRFVSHLVDRYGLPAVSTWLFEVWNEPNCGFWSGSIQEYFYLLKVTADAVHSVHPSLQGTLDYSIMTRNMIKLVCYSGRPGQLPISADQRNHGIHQQWYY